MMGSRPQLSAQAATGLSKDWGLQNLQADELDGYDDSNWRLTDAQGNCWVLKVHNHLDSQEPKQIPEAQNALLTFLATKGFPVPAPLPLVTPCQGDGFTLRTVADDGKRHAVRLLTWMPGTLLVDVAQSCSLYHKLGALLGSINRELQGSPLPLQFPALRREFDWDLRYLSSTYARVRAALLNVANVDVDLLDITVAQFQEATCKVEKVLRCSIIHSDANEKNVLVDGEVGEVSGLIDWGDAVDSWLAAEPAAACCYMMLLAVRDDASPLAAAAAVIAGYQSELKLLPEELLILRTLVMGRLVLSLSLGVYAATNQPDNQAYLLSTQQNGWQLLRLLHTMSDQQFLKQ